MQPNPPPSVSATNAASKPATTPLKVFDSSKKGEVVRTLSPCSSLPPKPLSHLPTPTSVVQKTPTKSTVRLATITPRIKLTPKKSPTGPLVKSSTSAPVPASAPTPAVDRPNALIKQKELSTVQKTASLPPPNVPSSPPPATKESPKPTSTTAPVLSSTASAPALLSAADKDKTVDKKPEPPKPIEAKLTEPQRLTSQLKDKEVAKPAESTKPSTKIDEKPKPVETHKLDQKPVVTKEKSPPTKEAPTKPAKVANDKAKTSHDKKDVKKSQSVAKSTSAPATAPPINEKVVQKKAETEQPRPEIKLIIRKDSKTSPKGETKSELKAELKSSPPSAKEPATRTKASLVKRETNATPTSSSSSESSRTKRQRKGVQPFQSPIPEIENVKKISITQAMTPKPADPKLILFYKNEFLAVRNAEGGFYLCQAMQNVTKRGQKIKIRWLNEEKTGSQIYYFDYLDKTDFECVLTTVELLKTGKNHMKIPNHELERVKHILKNAIDVEKGILPKPDLSEENPDGCKAA